ncbi:MAG: neutral/alkaline non-lysosomal ceramidase N-terminal domain-containing protein [Halioglobus sp.]
MRAFQGTAWRRLLALFCAYPLTALLLCTHAAAQPAPTYLVGRGITDITGPALDVQFWGFGRPDQIGEGIHTRLRSRAFIVADPANTDARLVYVSAELGSVDHHITLAVVENLQRAFGDQYHLANVIITATHTHSGPGGYWQSRTATGLDGGLYPQHFDAIVAGITASIIQAHGDLEPGNVYINRGRVANAGVNRSAVAYRENPEAERARYDADTNTEMLLLRFADASGDIGMLNWYALHPTAMNFHNHLVSGDHKGYASLMMEQARGRQPGSKGHFVAAFAQSDPGDVTPNTDLDNTGPGATDVDTTRIMGERQLQAASALFDSASEALRGPIETRQVYVDLSHYPVRAEFTGAGEQHTCPSAYGYSFAGGSSEDGGGHFLFREGMTKQQTWRDWLIRVVTGAPRWTEAVRRCQAPKPILFETGSGNPPLQSQVHSVTLARIGQLVILALPAEVTTMAGRRLRESVRQALGDWAGYTVLAGYANGYGGYVTTPQEYMLQQYEAGHTLHGRWTLPAYQQVASQLARALQHGGLGNSSARYDDWRGKAQGKPLPTGEPQALPAGAEPGDALPMRRAAYAPGETVAAEFYSSHPNRGFPRSAPFLRVERKVTTGWQTVADDSDWRTRIRWQAMRGVLIARITWDIPFDAQAGEYRVVHEGQAAQGKSFTGESAPFSVAATP